MNLRTTPEMLGKLEAQYLECADALDASSYAVMDLIADARTAHALYASLTDAIRELRSDAKDMDNDGDYHEGDVFRDIADHLETLPVYADPPDHSAGLRCHKCDGRLLPPGGLGGCAACKQVSAAENLKNEEGTRGTSAATPPPDSDIRQALDEALPGWDDPDERVTIAEAIRLIHQDRASIKAAAEKVLKSADPLFAKHANDGWWIRCRAAIDNIENLTAARDAAQTATAVWQAEANRLLSENRKLRTIEWGTCK